MDVSSEALAEPARVVAADSVADGWGRVGPRRTGREPIDAAVLGGLRAGRPGDAFVGGYRAALRALVPCCPLRTRRAPRGASPRGAGSTIDLDLVCSIRYSDEPPMKHVVPHGLGLETARKVTEAALASYKARFAQYKPEARWVSDQRAEVVFHVKGITLEGALEVGPHDIEMELEVPFLLAPFRGKAIRLVEEEIRQWVAKAKAGEI
jgi:hypothetical protein